MQRFEFTAELQSTIEDAFPDEQDLAELSKDDVEAVRDQLMACCDATLEVLNSRAQRVPKAVATRQQKVARGKERSDATPGK